MRYKTKNDGFKLKRLSEFVAKAWACLTNNRHLMSLSYIYMLKPFENDTSEVSVTWVGD